MTMLRWCVPMSLTSALAFAALLAAATVSTAQSPGGREDGALAEAKRDIVVASYYFPNYHPGDPRNDRQKGPGWSEWELVKAARPRFPGHQQPKVPLWGYRDESDPQVMEQKIAAAADHGIDAFIYDWYFYEDGPFLQRGLEEGFMKAPNVERLKFGLMWANHDWTEIFPATLRVTPPLVYPAKMSAAGFDRMVDYVIGKYFRHPSYWTIEGKPYFSVYDLNVLTASFGSVAATRAALDRFRERTRQAGLPGLYLNAVVWGRAVLPGSKTPTDPIQLVKDLGFDSTTSYVWVHHVAVEWPTMEFEKVRDGYLPHWETMLRDCPLPYFPNATVGWDSTPRTKQGAPWETWQYPYTGVVVGNTPAAFEQSLRLIKSRLLAAPTEPKVVTMNCWNEWTEGSYLEPDTKHRFAYLEAVRRVFGNDATNQN